MTRTREEAASRLLTAVEALAWFIENSNEDDPNHTSKFFRAREVWRDAMDKARQAGIEPIDQSPWLLITMGDKARED